MKHAHKPSESCISGYRRIAAAIGASLCLSCGSAQAQEEEPNLTDIVANELACELIDNFYADVRIEPLYRQGENGCEAVIPTQSGTYFSDAACTASVSFRTTEVSDHCGELLDPSGLGEGDGIDTAELPWTLSPGSKLDIGARWLDGVVQPYLRRLIYREVETGGGTCSLEMRVYSKHPGITGQRSMIAFHGGSWTSRGFGFFGLEMTIPHFVEQGFVVYAPFYRLLDEREGSAACHNATIEEIVSDAEAALAWVEANAADYGSSGAPIVFGQSAGGQLAASLVVRETDRVAGGVLYYAPSDFRDFGARAIAGLYRNEQGLDILERVTGSAIDSLNLDASPIPENSYPEAVASNGASIAPVFMLHGMADDLVEPRQSVRLCQAIAGESLMALEESPEVTGPGESRRCGDNSELHLSTQGQHAMDFCLVSVLVQNDLCLSGDEFNRAWIAERIGDSARWAAATADAAAGGSAAGSGDGNANAGDSATSEGDDSSGGGSSGGAVSWLLWLLVSGTAIRAQAGWFRTRKLRA
ncbi:MAG: hypothetical protein CSB44_06185 [Gammaproteobacteria bacterium]|nr:MAG: hypothetical protein CSB44_06185 [Gammaproteobacteria bacterium]